MRRNISHILVCGLRLIYASFLITVPCEASSQQNEYEGVAGEKILIYQLKPERREGRGYKLIYTVDASLEVFWKFKTDFDNEFLESNRHIKSHRFIKRRGNVVITHNEYTDRPGKVFKWQTTVDSNRHRLDFKLLNPSESGQNYHYGYIQLEALGLKTRVIQVAYFDFFGASLWSNYPFYGGMHYYLNNTARWEQETILKLKDRYSYSDERN